MTDENSRDWGECDNCAHECFTVKECEDLMILCKKCYQEKIIEAHQSERKALKEKAFGMD